MNDNELQHYGVKGMKWGVRKEYRSDKQTRRAYSMKAYRDGQAELSYAQQKRSADRKVDILKRKDDKKGVTSDKTKDAISFSKAMDKGLKQARKVTDISNKILQNHVKSMIEKYGSKKVKDVRYKEVDGRKYVDSFLMRLRDNGANYLIVTNASGEKGRRTYDTRVKRVQSVYTSI